MDNLAGWPLDKSLCFIPQLFGASLAYGRNLLRPEHTTERWRIRNIVVWCRPNPPVGALGDKVRPATSYLTIATKARDRYFDLDAVRTPLKHDYHTYERAPDSKAASRSGKTGEGPRMDRVLYNEAGAPPLDYWEIPTAPYKGTHYATYPPELCRIPILAMSPERVCMSCGKPSRRIVAPDPEGETRSISASTEAAEAARMNEWQSNRGDGQYQVPRDREGERTVGRAIQDLGWSCCGCGPACTATGIRWKQERNGPRGRDSEFVGTVGRCDDSHWRRGMVLDPFAGSGTTLEVATGMGRDAIGIDLDERNAELAQRRVGMFLTVEERRIIEEAV
jgi:hypothetical protein